MAEGDERSSALLQAVDATHPPWRERAADRRQLLVVIAVVVGAGLFIAATHQWGYSWPKPLEHFDAEAIAIADAYARAMLVEHDCAKATRLSTFSTPRDGTPSVCEPSIAEEIKRLQDVDYHLVRGSRRVEDGCCIRYRIVGEYGIDARGRDRWILRDYPIELSDEDPPKVDYGGIVAAGRVCPNECKAILGRRIPFTPSPP